MMSRIRPRRSKPREWENRSVYYAYKDANPFDEIAHLFPPDPPADVTVPLNGKNMHIARNQTADQCHHICGGILGARRWDVATNLIHLSHWTHAFAERYQPEGLVLCAAAKIDKDEWRSEAMAIYMGVASIAGWLSRFEMRWPWVQVILDKYRDSI